MNTDLPINSRSVVALVAHELYPGHHTERVWKEQLLYTDRGQLEESVLVYGTPQSVITEGIATLAARARGGRARSARRRDAARLRPRVRPRPGAMDPAGGQAARGAMANAAIMLHVDGVSTDEAAEYLLAGSSARRTEPQSTSSSSPTGGGGRASGRTQTDTTFAAAGSRATRRGSSAC